MLLLLLGSAQVSAGGLTIPGAGPHGQARAGAFVAKADDPSALLYNPAGFAKIDGTHFTLGVNMVNFDQEFQRAGSYEATPDSNPFEGERYPLVRDTSKPSFGLGGYQAIPFIGISTDLGHPEWPVRFGIGLNSIQGYVERKYPRRVDINGVSAPAPQRYDVVSQSAAPIRPSIAVAYSLNDKINLGLRLGWGILRVAGSRSSWSVANYSEREDFDTFFDVTDGVDAFVPTYGLGMTYRLSDNIEFGAEYSSEFRGNAVGNGLSEGGDVGLGPFEILPVDDEAAGCAPGGQPGALKACVEVGIPRRATVGARYVLRDESGLEKADLEFDVRWENYASVKNSRIIVDGRDSITGQSLNPGQSRSGFHDVFSFRLGGAYRLKAGSAGITLRGGVAHDTSTAPDGFLRLDKDGKARTTLATGVGIDVGRFRVDLGGGIVLEQDVEIAQCKPETNGPTVNDRGCGTNGVDRPISERTGPDPLQPKLAESAALENPFNAGTIKSGYLMMSLGISTRF